MQSALRMVILKVMYENGIDVFVNPEQTTAPYKLGYAGEPEVNDRLADQLLHGVHGARRHAGDGRAGRLHDDQLRLAVRS